MPSESSGCVHRRHPGWPSEGVTLCFLGPGGITPMLVNFSQLPSGHAHLNSGSLHSSSGRIHSQSPKGKPPTPASLALSISILPVPFLAAIAGKFPLSLSHGQSMAEDEGPPPGESLKHLAWSQGSWLMSKCSNHLAGKKSRSLSFEHTQVLWTEPE